MKNKLFIFIVLALTAFTFTMLHAQSKKEIKEKLAKLKGEIEKIVISTDEGVVTFEGEEAKEIGERLTNFYGEKDWIFEIKSDDDKEEIFILRKGDSKGNINWVTSGGDSSGNLIFLEKMKGASKKFQIGVEEGSKKVTVTKIDENGDEITETFEGDEADEYLKELEEEGDIRILQIDKLGGKKEKVKIMIEKLKDN